MENFRGFTEQTNDFLVGIKFNNNKEWFNANKLMYTENVHKPMVALANEVYEKMHEYKKNFYEKPKISRINRDIRFSNNKSPYKISKWFFLRGDGSPHSSKFLFLSYLFTNLSKAGKSTAILFLYFSIPVGVGA